MNDYYPRSTYRYFSKIDPSQTFETEKEARAHDRSVAIDVLLCSEPGDFVEAFQQRDEEIVAALKFLVAETDVPEWRARADAEAIDP